MQLHAAVLVCAMHLFDIAEQHALALGVNAITRHVIKPEHDVLRWNDDRVAISR